MSSLIFIQILLFSIGISNCVKLISYSSNTEVLSNIIPSTTEERGFEYISSISLFPIDSFENISFNATITLPPQSPSSFSDTQQQLWFYTTLGPSNNSLVDHLGIQAKVEFGRYKEFDEPNWIIRCLFISNSALLETFPIPISNPSAYVYSTGQYDPNSSILTLYTQIIAAEDSSKIASLLAIIDYTSSVPFQFEPSIVMEAQNILEDGCESFPKAGIAIYEDIELSVNSKIYNSIWTEQNGIGSYSPNSPCNITISQIEENGFLFLWS